MQAVPKKQKAVYSVASAPGGFRIQADGNPLKTPAGADFIVPTKELAEVIAGEWQAQGDKTNPASMPFTQLALTAIDITNKDREKIIEQLLAYLGSELLCHHAEEPPELTARQNEVWQSILDWCEQNFDDAIFRTGNGIMPIKQPEETHTAMRDALERYDAFALTGLRHAVDVSGSLVLGLALAEKHLNAKEVFEAAELDSLFQIKKWGEDPVTVKRHETIRHELAACEKWFGLLAR